MITYADISSPYLLVSELDLVEFSAQSTLQLVITDASSATVISCSYTPVDGVVRVYDLDRLLSPLIEGVMADFIAGHFLSPVTFTRDTTLQRREMVTLLCSAATDVTAACPSVDDSDVIHTDNVSLETGLAAGLHEVECSPSLLVNDSLGTLVFYVVRAGDRSMSFRVSPTATDRCAMLMRNDFGAWEPCYFEGMNEVTPDITREFVQVGGIQRPLRVQEQENTKSFTGPLRPGEVQLFCSLARSTDIVLLEDGAATDPVVISGQEVKYTDDDAHVPSITFTWHRASLRTMMHVPVTPRIFDDTFDETFE